MNIILHGQKSICFYHLDKNNFGKTFDEHQIFDKEWPCKEIEEHLFNLYIIFNLTMLFRLIFSSGRTWIQSRKYGLGQSGHGTYESTQ
jgi:hypothetical protein